MVTIPTIDQISGTTVMNKMRSLINNYIEFGGEIANTVNYMEEVIRNLPQDVTDVYNNETVDGMFTTAYTYIDTNFYKKTEVYTKAEVNNLVETVGSFRVVIVDELPEMGQEGIIYLIQRTTATENDYDEYIWISQWELIGQLSGVDLDNYYTKSQSDAKYTQGVGDIGSDVRPVKIVNGVATPVSKDVINEAKVTNGINLAYNVESNNTTGFLQVIIIGKTATIKGCLVSKNPEYNRVNLTAGLQELGYSVNNYVINGMVGAAWLDGDMYAVQYGYFSVIRTDNSNAYLRVGRIYQDGGFGDIHNAGKFYVDITIPIL